MDSLLQGVIFYYTLGLGLFQGLCGCVLFLFYIVNPDLTLAYPATSTKYELVLLYNLIKYAPVHKQYSEQMFDLNIIPTIKWQLKQLQNSYRDTSREEFECN